MKTDTLIETTWIKNPEKLHTVRFTDWQQADALRQLLKASGFELHVSLTAEPQPQLQFYITFLNDGRGDKVGTERMSQGDYLVTSDEPKPGISDDLRTWHIMDADELEAGYRCHD